jgi:hypothetical protein
MMKAVPFCLLVSGCAALGIGEPPASKLATGNVFYAQYRGSEVAKYFEVAADGKFAAWETDLATGKRFNERYEKRDPALYGQLVELLEPLGHVDQITCPSSKEMGAPVDRWRWTSHGEAHLYGFYTGCYSATRTPEIQQVADIEKAAFALVNAP